MMFNTNNRPIKIVFEGEIECTSIGDHDITVTRKLTLSEIAALFGVDRIDILEGKIGIWTLDEAKES